MKTNFFKSFLLALIAAMLPQLASAYYDFEYDGLFYKFNDDGISVTVTIEGEICGKSVTKTASSRYYDSGELNIPETVTPYDWSDETYLVTSIDDGVFGGWTGLTSVTLPNSLTSIGAGAFSGCTGLTSVTIPNSVTSIGGYAFYGCSGLTSVTIGNSVTSIGECAFQDCTSLTSVTWNAKNCSDFTIYDFAPFNGDYDITSFVFGNEVEHIPAYLCSDCIFGLTSVTIPNSVKSIGSSAFSNCGTLTKVNISDLAAWCNIDFEGAGANPLCNANYLYLNGSKVTDLVIPNSITAIKNYAFINCTGLTSVTIPNSLTSIGAGAFSGCTGLTSVTIPNSVTSIGGSAFSGCSGLTSVTIPNSVTEIGKGAFSSCSGLTSMVVESGNTNYDSRNNCNAIIKTETNTLISGCTNTIIPNSVTSIGESAFAYCSGLTSVTIPNSVTSIGYDAFSGCTSLTEVTWNANNCSNFSESNAPFKGLTGITSFVFGNEVEHIPTYLCYGLTGLTSVTIPNSVTEIGNSAFSGCTGLTSVNINDLAAWCNITFNDINANPLSCAHNLYLNGSKVTNLVIPNSVSIIKNYSFSGCSSLTSVSIPNSVTSIGNRAFSGCSGLTSVKISDLEAWCNIDFGDYDANPLSCAHNLYLNGSKVTNLVIPNSVSIIKNYSFSGCSRLTSVSIPNSVTSIGNRAFSGCSGLTEVTIPNSVTSIGNYAFYGCTGLIEVTIPNSVTWVGENAFYGTAWYNNQPDGLVYAGMVAYKYKGTMPEGATIILKDGCTMISNNCFYGCGGLTKVIIPNSVTSIGAYAFSNCYGLTSMSLIDEYTFEYEHIITIPNSVTSIGDYAFENCGGFNSVTISNSVTSIGTGVFYGCNGLTSVTIPNSVTSISDEAFAYCTYLRSVTIPNSVTSIGYDVFYDCGNLTGDPDLEVHFYLKIKNPNNVIYGGENENYAYQNIFNENETWAWFIHVPKGKYDIYCNSFPWYIFSPDRIIEMDPTGDVNDDGTVNVGDYVATASYILEQDPQPFYFEECDFDDNYVINVGDLVGVAYIALHYGDEPMRAPAVGTKETPSLAMAADVIGKNGNYEVTINLSNDVDIAALQMDLNLPAGMTLVDASLSDRASASHQVAFNQLSNGDYRLLASSSTCKSFNGNDGAVLTLTLAGEPSGNGIIKNIELATPRAASYKVDNIELNFTSPTGIEDMTAATTTRIYSEGGNIVIISPNDDTAQIVLPNGMNKTVKVAVGHNVYEAPAKGIVIVKMGNEVKKMRF